MASIVKVLVGSTSVNLTEEEKIANRNKRFGAQRQPKVNSAMLQKSMQSSTSAASLLSPPPPPPLSSQQQQVAVAAVSEVQDPGGAVAEEVPESAAPASLGQPREPLEQELEEGEEPTVE